MSTATRIGVPLLLLLSGCFQMQIQHAKQECQQEFPPDAQPQLYMHCIDTAMQDIQQRRAIFAQSIQQAGQNAAQSMQQHPVNCQTNCVGTFCNTVCN